MTAPVVSDRVLDRLSKLMSLADSSNEHEANLAAERAAQLMAEHQISAADLAGRGAAKASVERGRIDAEDSDDGFSRVEAWHKGLAASIADAMGGRLWLHGYGRHQRFMMIGPPDVVASARYMYLHLEKQINRMSRAAARAHGETQNAWRRAYCLGMVGRVYERMLAGRKTAMQAATSTAMVHVDAQKKAVDEAFDEMVLKPLPRTGAKLKRADAGSHGYVDGADVDLGSSDAKRLGQGQRKLKS